MTAWLQTMSGVAFSLEAPTPDMVRPDDVAFALSNLTRFTGHVRTYSVADHCLRVMRRVAADGEPRDVVLAALLHDAPEAFVGDVASPLKRLLGDAYRSVEARVATAVAHRFGLSPDLLHHPAIVRADLRMLMTEARDLLGPPPQPWGISATPYDDTRIVPLRAAEAEELYLEALRDLGAIP
jgi:uncharacterized protein